MGEPERDVVLNIDVNASLKRIAWAYGCAKKDSGEEGALHERLLQAVNAELAAKLEVARELYAVVEDMHCQWRLSQRVPRFRLEDISVALVKFEEAFRG